MGKKDQPENSEETKSQIDLGEDLLEKTNTAIQDYSIDPSQGTVFDVEDAFRSAEILIEEDLFEDAKKLLRKILRKEPQYHRARRALEKLENQEIQSLLSPAQKSNTSKETSQLDHEGVEAIQNKLDQELGLNDIPNMPLKKNKVIGEKSIQSELDIVIAMIELGQWDQAIQASGEAVKKAQRELDENEALRVWISGVYLKAVSFFFKNEDHHVLLEVASVTESAEVESQQKVPFVYLRARSYENLSKTKNALICYQQIIEIDPDYRDTRSRLQMCKSELTEKHARKNK